jgi:hypothetical protein
MGLERHSDRTPFIVAAKSARIPMPFAATSRWLYISLAVLHAVSLRREDERAKKAARSIASSKRLVNRRSSARKKEVKRHRLIFGICSLLPYAGASALHVRWFGHKLELAQFVGKFDVL